MQVWQFGGWPGKVWVEPLAEGSSVKDSGSALSLVT